MSNRVDLVTIIEDYDPENEDDLISERFRDLTFRTIEDIVDNHQFTNDDEEIDYFIASDSAIIGNVEFVGKYYYTEKVSLRSHKNSIHN